LKEHFSREKENSIAYNKSCSNNSKQLISRLKTLVVVAGKLKEKTTNVHI